MKFDRSWTAAGVAAAALVVSALLVLSLPAGEWRTRVGYVVYAFLALVIIQLTLRVLENRSSKRH
jgi:hypothetical protein